ncbi:(+)-neomenthol dehydrogenase-like [Dioscorea cayenensis subsp. rotundata]|uniref:(+)-neomenthol dehydrogenase-like n=1 Tax=Dioscorea cayennensis subsp. rotundata TaxID=55577 RepID=A0AB40BYC8_DIOCR|nr:(+)-neomenthol dehydrogenase-like [Dioscorea cayenensis subsp. rotundata]
MMVVVVAMMLVQEVVRVLVYQLNYILYLVSSLHGMHTKGELTDIDNLSEEVIENVLDSFLEDLKKGNLEFGGWPLMLPSYSISKVALNAYTRVLAKKHTGMRINCVHPSYVKTNINWHTEVLKVEDVAKSPVMLAFLPPSGPMGCYFDQTTMAEF